MSQFENKARWTCKNGHPEFISGSRILTTPEQIVREFRIGAHDVRIEHVKEPISKLERAIQIFLIFAFGWLFGYLCHFMTTPG